MNKKFSYNISVKKAPKVTRFIMENSKGIPKKINF